MDSPRLSYGRCCGGHGAVADAGALLERRLQLTPQRGPGPIAEAGDKLQGRVVDFRPAPEQQGRVLAQRRSGGRSGEGGAARSGAVRLDRFQKRMCRRCCNGCGHGARPNAGGPDQSGAGIGVAATSRWATLPSARKLGQWLRPCAQRPKPSWIRGTGSACKRPRNPGHHWIWTRT